MRFITETKCSIGNRNMRTQEGRKVTEADQIIQVCPLTFGVACWRDAGRDVLGERQVMHEARKMARLRSSEDPNTRVSREGEEKVSGACT